jgi:ABC-type Na+ transport system ATPase subunit NatA
MTVRQYLAYSLSLTPLDPAVKAARTDTLLQTVCLTKYARRKLKRLTAVQYLSVQIAAALVHHPARILLHAAALKRTQHNTRLLLRISENITVCGEGWSLRGEGDAFL